MNTVKKAVIPAAGWGTRFLPVTKSVPKEMIPVVDTPVIQYVVEEAVASGITDILIVVGRTKRAIEEHFDRTFALEEALAAKGRQEDLERLKYISTMARVSFVWQHEMKGLGDAVLCAREHVGNEPFALLLGDCIVDSSASTEGADGTYAAGKPVTLQLVEVFERYQASVVSLEEVSASKVQRYGVIDGVEVEPGVLKATDFVEKPKPELAPTNLAFAGRYVFTPAIFDALQHTPRGLGNEIQLTDAMRLLLQEQSVYGCKTNGIRYDIGNKLDFIKTNVLFGLRNGEVGPALKEWLDGLR